MNIHSQSKAQLGLNKDHPFQFRSAPSCGGIEISQADTIDDFFQVTHLLVKAARRRQGGISGLSIGSILAGMNHHGSGPDTGCVLIAKTANRITGIAVLTAKAENEIEITWLNADNDTVASLLWDHAFAVMSEWGKAGIRLGQFVEVPRHLFGRASSD
ncbi:MAG: hypothetical protein AAF362_10505 [Pseudomonadota bacterium]